MRNIEIYNSDFDRVNNTNLDKIETLYQIGFDMFDNKVVIQESNGYVYTAFHHLKLQDRKIARAVYFNASIQCFARCLNLYEDFYHKYFVARMENIKIAEIQNICIQLRESLKALDETILISSSSGEIESDDYWAYLLEDLYYEFGNYFLSDMLE